MKTSITTDNFDISQIYFPHENNDLARFYELSSDLFCITGFDGYLKKVNPAFIQLLGYSEQELLARPFIEFILSDDLDKTINCFKSVIDGSDLKYFENRYCSKDGSVKWLSWRFFVVQEELLIYAIARDVTEEKAAQISIIEQTDTLKELVLYKNEGLKYAGFLQEAIFQDPEAIKSIFPQSFIFYFL